MVFGSGVLFSCSSSFASLLQPRTVTPLLQIKLAIRTAILILGVLAISGRPANAQCPAVGADTTCGTVITITNSGASVSSTGQGPYDGSHDILVGVINNSSQPIFALGLTSGLAIFGFDGDISTLLKGDVITLLPQPGPNRGIGNTQYYNTPREFRCREFRLLQNQLYALIYP